MPGTPLPVKAKAKKSRRPNPLRMDPTRTASLRRAFERQITLRFEKLKAKLRALLLEEDALGLDVEKRDTYFSHPVLGRNSLYVNCGGPGSGVPGPCPSVKAALKGFEDQMKVSRGGVKAGTLHPKVAEGNVELAKDDLRTIVGSRVETALLKVRRAMRQSGKGQEFKAVREAVEASLEEFNAALRARVADVGGETSKEDRYWNRKEVLSKLKKVGENLAWARRRAGLTTNERDNWIEQMTLNCGGPGSGVPGPCPGPSDDAAKGKTTDRLRDIKTRAEAGGVKDLPKEGWETLEKQLTDVLGGLTKAQILAAAKELGVGLSVATKEHARIAIRRYVLEKMIALVSIKNSFSIERNWLDQMTLNCGGPGSGVPGPCPAGVSSEEAAKGRSFTNRLKSLGAKANEIEHALKEKIASAISKLPEPLQVGLSVLYHTAFAGWTASQALAERVAIERGSTPEQAARLRGVLAAADIAAFKPVAIGLSASGVGAGLQAITWIVPPATGAYLAYSAVRNPIKTAKAALGLVKEAVQAGIERIATLNVEADLADLMADALEAHDYDDWYVAIFIQALSLDLSPQEAVAVANEVYAKNPISSAGDEGDLDSDAEELFAEKIAANSLTVNAGRWQFATDPQKVKEFKAWLRSQLREELTGRSEKELWEAYTRLGLQKGAGRAFDDTRRPQRVAAELAGKSDFYAGTRDEFLRSSFNKPVAVEKVQLLAERAFDELENVTSGMATRMTRTLTDGLVKGDGPRDIARELDRDLDIGRNRSLAIARTEIVRAHAEGQLMALEQLGVEEVGVAVEWSTAGDDHVCELCQPLEGMVLTLAEAKGMLPRHVNCRCAWLPANVGENPKDQKDTQASIGRALDISVERDGGFDRSRWGGADLEPDEERPQSQVGNVDYLAAFSRAIANCGGEGGTMGPCPKGDKHLVPKTEKEAQKIADKLREDTVEEGTCALDGDCQVQSAKILSEYPNAEVWSGSYEQNPEQNHLIVRLGKYFIDVTADQFSGGQGVKAKVFTIEDMEPGGFAEEYGGFQHKPALSKALSKIKGGG